MRMNIIKLQILVILHFFTSLAQDDGIFLIDISSDQAGALSKYTFTILPYSDISVPADTTIQVVFPIQFQETLQDGAHVCEPIGWTNTNSFSSCNIVGLTLQINGGYPSATTITSSLVYDFTVENIRNPIYAQATSLFRVILKDTTSNTVFSAYSNFGTEGITINEGKMTCSITSAPTGTSQDSVMIVQMNAPVMIPYNTTLKITMAKYWPTNAIDVETIMEAPGTCIGITNVSGSITCEVSVTTSISINVQNLVDSDIQGSIIFSVSPMMNPPTTQPQGQITISSKKDGVYPMAKCSNNKIYGITANYLEGLAYTVQDYTVNTQTKAYLQFTVHSYLEATDNIVIHFPSQMQLTSIENIFIENTYYTDYSPSIVGQIVTTEGASATPMQTIKVQISDIINPSSQLQTSNFYVQILRDTHQVEISTNTLTFAARRGVLSVSATATNYEIGKQSEYIFQIQFSNPLTSTSLVIIKIPNMFSSSINIGTTQCQPTCIFLNTSQAQFQYSALTISSSKTILKIKNIINPLEIGNSDTFQIITQLDPAQPQSIVDGLNQGIILQFTARTIQTISVTSNSDVVYNSPTEITFSADNLIPINAYSSIKIQIPPTITVYTGDILCKIGSTNLACSFDQYSRLLQIDSFSSSVIPISSLDDVIINNIFNPPSTKTMSSFKFYIVNSNGEIVQKAQSGITYPINTPASFTTLSLTTNNSRNSAQTSLTVSFSISIQTGYTNLSVLVLSFPSQIVVSSATCSIISANLQAITCNKNINQLKVRLSFSDTTVGQQTAFTITNFKNFPSIQQYQIEATLHVSSLQQHQICSDTYTLINNQLSEIAVNSYSFSQPILAQSSSLTFSIVPASNNFQSLKITFPSQFSISSLSCSLPTGLTCSSSSSNIIDISPTSDPFTYLVPITVTINNIITPSYTPSTPITIQTISSTGYLMSQDISMIFQTLCTLPCRTCNSQPTFCLSCYTDALLVSGKTIFDSNQCKSSCNNKYYHDSNTGQCEACSTNCQLCVDYSFCTSCPANNYLNLIDNTCLSDCPSGFYEYSNRCQQCNSALNCQSCDDSSECLSCSSGYFFYEGLCLSSCPTLITYQDAILNQCKSCPENCTQCSGSQLSVTCSKCQNGYLLDNQRCYLECITPGLVRQGQQCIPCSSLCYTCQATQFNCISCDPSSSNPYFYQNRCLSVCPDGFYEQIATTQCQPCTQPCQICTSASVNSCISCISNFYLHGSTCVQSCPSTYYPNIYQCSSCVSPCLQCSSQSICISCVGGQYLYGTRCVTECDPGMTIINGNQCLVCDPSCKSCSTSSYCTECFSSNYLYNGTCSINCPQGTYQDSILNSCLACVDPCQQCSSAIFCITCVNENLVVQNGACLASCTAPLIPVNLVCVSCDISCATCQNSITNCIQCSNNYYYFTDTGTCSSVCSHYIYTNTINIECVQTCPEQHYPDGNNICQQCPQQCIQCISTTNCSSCSANYNYYNYFCYDTCPSQSKYTYNNQCYPCDRSLCQQCQNDGTQSCKICKNNTYKINESSTYICIEACQSGYNYDSQKLACLQQEKPTDDNDDNNSTTTDGNFDLISDNGVPNYIFAMGGILMGVTIALSRIYSPDTNIISSILIGSTLIYLGSFGSTLSYEIVEIKNSIDIIAGQRLLQQGTIIANDNPTSFLIMIAVGIHILGIIMTLIALLCIKDYALKGLFQDHPIFTVFFIILILIDYRMLWLLCTNLFGLAVFNIKFCKLKMVVLMKMGLVFSLLETVLLITYSGWIISIINSLSTTRLLLSQSGISKDNISPYIQLLFVSCLLFIASIAAFFIDKSHYYIQKTPSFNMTRSLLADKNQNNQSMNQLISQKDAIDQRFSQQQDLIASQFKEQEKLYGFGVDEDNITESQKQNNNLQDPLSVNFGQKASKTAPNFFQNRINKQKTQKTNFDSNRPSIKQKSSVAIIQVQTHDVNLQVNLDQMMLPALQEEDILQQETHKQIQLQNNKNSPYVSNNANPFQTVSQQNISKIEQIQQQQKSQPSWAQFKLGSKYKQDVGEQAIYLGYVYEQGQQQVFGSMINKNKQQLKKNQQKQQSVQNQQEDLNEQAISQNNELEGSQLQQNNQTVRQSDERLLSMLTQNNKQSQSRSLSQPLQQSQSQILSQNSQKHSEDIISYRDRLKQYSMVQTEQQQVFNVNHQQQQAQVQVQTISQQSQNIIKNTNSQVNYQQQQAQIQGQTISQQSQNIINYANSEVSLITSNIPQEFMFKVESRLSQKFVPYQKQQFAEQQQNLEEQIPKQFIVKSDQIQEEVIEDNQNLSQAYVSFYSQTVNKQNQQELEVEENIPQQFQYKIEKESRLSSKFQKYHSQSDNSIEEDQDIYEPSNQSVQIVYEEEDYNDVIIDQADVDNTEKKQQINNNDIFQEFETQFKQQRDQEQIGDFQQQKGQKLPQNYSAREYREQPILIKQQQRQDQISSQLFQTLQNQLQREVPAPIINRKTVKKDPISLLGRLKNKRNRKQLDQLKIQKLQQQEKQKQNKQNPDESEHNTNNVKQEIQQSCKSEFKEQKGVQIQNNQQNQIIVQPVKIQSQQQKFQSVKIKQYAKTQKFYDKKPVKLRIPSQNDSSRLQNITLIQKQRVNTEINHQPSKEFIPQSSENLSGISQLFKTEVNHEANVQYPTNNGVSFLQGSSIKHQNVSHSQMGASLLLINDEYDRQKPDIPFIQQDQQLEQVIITPLPKRKKATSIKGKQYEQPTKPSQLLQSVKEFSMKNKTTKNKKYQENQQKNKQLEIPKKNINPFKKKGKDSRYQVIYEETDEDFGTIVSSNNTKSIRQNAKSQNYTDKKPSQLLDRHSFKKIGQRILDQSK